MDGIVNSNTTENEITKSCKWMGSLDVIQPNESELGAINNDYYRH